MVKRTKDNDSLELKSSAAPSGTQIVEQDEVEVDESKPLEELFGDENLMKRTAADIWVTNRLYNTELMIDDIWLDHKGEKYLTLPARSAVNLAEHGVSKTNLMNSRRFRNLVAQKVIHIGKLPTFEEQPSAYITDSTFRDGYDHISNQMLLTGDNFNMKVKLKQDDWYINELKRIEIAEKERNDKVGNADGADKYKDFGK